MRKLNSTKETESGGLAELPLPREQPAAPRENANPVSRLCRKTASLSFHKENLAALNCSLQPLRGANQEPQKEDSQIYVDRYSGGVGNDAAHQSVGLSLARKDIGNPAEQ